MTPVQRFARVLRAPDVARLLGAAVLARMPIGIDSLVIRHLSVGQAAVDLTFQRVGDRVGAFLAEPQEGLVPLVVRS